MAGAVVDRERAARTELADGARLFARAVCRGVAPKQSLAVSSWADAHRVLDSRASAEPGPWHTDRVPYLREIMDCLSERSPVERVVFMKSAQTAGTEALLNWVGYVIDHAPAPMLVVLPTLEVRARWVRQRLDPLCLTTPAVSRRLDVRRRRDSINSEAMKVFPGGILVIGGANSPASLASMPIRYIACDELDRFPWRAGQEGDPLGLIEERAKAFARRKILLVSTPTIAGASRIEAEYEASDQRRYHVPCPHCAERIVLRWPNLRWDRAGRSVWYLCEHCGAEIDESQKPAMLAAGQWIASYPERPVRGYHINGLYAPPGLGHSWAEMVRQFRAVKDDPQRLKQWVNTALGETWEDRSRSVRANTLIDRADPYRIRTVPPGALILTCGVDVQDDRLAVEIVGWGRRMASWVIDWLELPGNPGRAEVWQTLAEYLGRPLVNASGREMNIQATAVDSGGHFTHEVYDFARRRPARRVIATKGANTPGKPILSARPSTVDVHIGGRLDRRGAQVWIIGTDTAKHMLYGRLAADAGQEPAARLVHFSEDLPAEFYDQITAETFDPDRNRWVLRRGRRNEALDCWVMAAAAAHHPEVRAHAMRARDWDRLEQMLEPAGGAEPSAGDIERDPGRRPAEQRRKPRTGLGREDWLL